MALTDRGRFERWYGRPEPPLPIRTFNAGGLELLVEGVDVRRVTYAGVPVMDRIFVAIRDVDWGTLPAIMDSTTDTSIDPVTGATVLTFRASHSDASIGFSWQGRISIGPGATVSMEMDGVAERPFRYARMGLCALLPASSMAGRPVRGSGAGPVADAVLPSLVGPQLVVDGAEVPLVPAFRELDVDLPGMVVQLRYEGDDFELEDQRNWTDDSFKAYSLMSGEALPRSAVPGQRFWQRITLGVTAGTSSSAVASGVRSRSADAVISVGNEPMRWPSLGLGASSDERPLDAAEGSALAALRLDHLRADVHPGRAGWQARLRRDAADAAWMGAGLELAVSLDRPALQQLGQVADLVGDTPVRRVLVFHAPTQATATTPTGWLADARAGLGAAFPAARWIFGTDGDFAEINRDRPMPGGADAADGVCYGLNPQIHASDEMSMAETLPAQGVTVATAAAWFPGGDVCVTPVTLRQRFNPAALVAGDASQDAGAAADRGSPGPSLPVGVDLRQRSLFGAVWALGSIAALTAAAATSATWFETVGWRGLLERTDPPDRPGWGPVMAGEVYPLYEVFRDLADRRTMTPVRCTLADRDLVALGMRSGQRARLLIGNLSTRTIRARVEGLPSGSANCRILDELTPVTTLTGSLDTRLRTDVSVDAGTTTIELPPFATVRLDAGT